MEKETNQQNISSREQWILANSGTGITTELWKATRSFIKVASLAVAAFSASFHVMPIIAIGYSRKNSYPLPIR